MKYRVVMQPDEMACGISCLSTICAYYGIKNLSLSILRDFAQTDREGNTIYSLRKAAEKINLDSKSFECSKSALFSDKVNYPMIVHTLVNGMYNHYMVLFEVKEKGVVLGDPANGQVEMKWEEFEKLWTKRIILLKPNENFSETKKYKRNYKILINLILKFKKELIITAIFTGVISATSAVIGQFYSNLIDKVIPQNSMQTLVKSILVVIGMLFVTVQLNLIKQKYTIKFNKELDKELIVKIYDRIINLPMSFFSTRTAGDINARYNDGDSLRSIITGFSLGFITQIGYAIWALCLLLSINWQICVISVIMEEVMLLVQKIYKKKMSQQNREMMQKSMDLDSFVVSSFSASETVKSYNSEKLMEHGMEDRFKKFQDIKYKNDMSMEIQGNIISTISQIGNMCMLGVLGLYVMSGNITTGEMVKAYMYVSYLYAPISYLTGIQRSMNETSAVLERLDDVFRTTTEEERDKKKRHLSTNIQKIEFKNASFHYGMKADVLKNISFTAQKGDSIGIIGTSGCGKTTLIKLILSFFQVTGGTLEINGEDTNNISAYSIRKRIAYVSQNDFWFQDTIYNNLRIGNPGITTEKLDKICETVKMKEYIEKAPYGYNSMIEEGATNLSSGERQRLSIAKALAAEPDVLILDESTSNLDAETEEFVVEKLKQEEDKIKIIVAHRLNTLRHCNMIIAIDKGEIVEKGTPDELMKRKGMFYRFWTSQSNAFGEIETEKENKNLN